MINSFGLQEKSNSSWESQSSKVRNLLASSEKTLEESRLMDERIAKVRREAEESRKSAQETIDRLSNTIGKIQGTIEGLNETSKKIEEYEGAFKNLMEKAALHLMSTFGANNNLIGGSPTKASAKSAAEAISNCKKIMLLTGAGISVASGIPTFRGEGGFWTIRDSNMKLKAIDFLTNKYFLENPSEIWRWHHVFKRLKEKNKYNDAHREIAEFQCFCLKNNIPLMLVTQNVDEFHVEAFEDVVRKYPKIASQVPQDWKDVNSDLYGLHPHVFAIHGSVNYIRYPASVENAPKRLYPYPPSYNEDTLPLIGDKPSRPHTLLFDENYDDQFYRTNTVTNFSRDCDCLVVVGTALETSMAARIVCEAIRRKAVVIEINPDPCIAADGVLQLKGTSEEFLNEMFQLAQKNMSSQIQPEIQIQEVKQITEMKTSSQASGKIPQTTTNKHVIQAAPSKSTVQQQKTSSTVSKQTSKPNLQSQNKQVQTTSTTRKPVVSSTKNLKK